MHGLLGCNINTGVHARARGADVSLRDVTIARDGANDVSHWKRTEDSGNLEKVRELRRDTERDGWLSLARGDFCGGCHTCWRGIWKSQNRKIVPLSPYVEKPLNSKVIKSFAPELKSRYVFFEFRDSYVLSLWTFDVCFTHSHIMAMVHNPNFSLWVSKLNCLNFQIVTFLSILCFCYILTRDWAVNQEMHLCKQAEEERKQVDVKQ